MNAHEIKALQSRIAKQQALTYAAKEDLTTAQTEYNSHTQVLNDLKERLKKIEDTQDLKVSEHALLRYLERFFGVNLEEITDKILCDQVRKCHATLGSGEFPISGGGKAVVKQNTVVTIK